MPPSYGTARPNEREACLWRGRGSHRELGIALAGTDAPSAEKHLRVGIELFERIEQPLDVAVSYRWLGDLLGARGDDAAGCDAYRTGILAL